MYQQFRRRESEIPRCPFCQQAFGDFFKWTCSCEAIGVYDSTGNNLGEAMMEGLVLASRDDWDKALSLEEDQDYSIKHLEGYNPFEHRVLGGKWTYKTGRGAFIFIKLL
jgi:hypothetical protein